MTSTAKLGHLCIGASKKVWELSNVKLCLNTEQRADLETARACCLLGYHACSKHAKERGQFLYPIKPKFHKLDHLCRRACRTGISPSQVWCFGGEDVMKWMAAVARSAHGNGVASSTSRLRLGWFVRTLTRRVPAETEVARESGIWARGERRRTRQS